jgi:hypothetical protein
MRSLSASGLKAEGQRRIDDHRLLQNPGASYDSDLEDIELELIDPRN